MSAVTGAGAKPGKQMPEGVDRNLQATLRYAVGLPSAGKVADQDAVVDNIDKFFLAPNTDKLPRGFTSVVTSDSFTNKPRLLGMALMTKRKKPVAAYFVPDEDNSDEGVLALALRGDRKQTETKYIKMDNGIAGNVTASIYTTTPRSSCNFHPWYSSIISSFDESFVRRDESGTDVSDVDVDFERTASIVAKAIRTNRIIIVLCMPRPVAFEGLLHKLAHEKPPSEVSVEEANDHESKWADEVYKKAYQTCLFKQHPGGDAARLPSRLKDVGLAINAACKYMREREEVVEKPVEKPAEKPAEKPTEKPKKKKVVAESDDDVEDAQQQKLNKKEKRDDRINVSGKPKFVSEALEASSKEDEREERATREFEKKAQKMEDSDDDDSDSDEGSSKKKDKKKKNKNKKKKNHSDSSDESSMSDSDDDSDDDDSDDDDSGEDDSDEDTSSEDEATSSDEEDDKPKKKTRLVKTAHKEVLDRKMTQTTLQANGTLSSAAVGSKASRGGGARGFREGVASQAKLMLDAVENCSGVPLSSMAKIKKTVDKLREGFIEYKSEKFPISSTYSLYTSTFELTMMLVHALNATVTAEQQGSDGNTTRRLAVNTTSAILQIVPSIQQVMASMQEGVKAIGELDKITKAVADDFKKTADAINED